MISVLILGQPFAATRIARALNSLSVDLRATFIPPRGYVRLLATPPRSDRVVIMRAGYRIGAKTPRGRLFDAYWSMLRRSLPDAVPCHFWVGTDVLKTVEDVQAGTLRLAALTSARDDLHLAVAPWLVSELESVGLHASIALLPPPIHIPELPPPLPSEFSVLTYLPTGRFEFFGGETILEVARRLPLVRFDVVASRGDPARSAPANVHWHGWVADMPLRYASTTVVVRIPRHDGFGKTVIEGLLNARHIIYTHEVPFVHRVSSITPEALAEELAELYRAHAAGQLSLNLAGRAYALDAFDEAMLGDRLRALMRAGA
jgi:hypothetical protein